MTPEAALETQIERYRTMNGEHILPARMLTKSSVTSWTKFGSLTHYEHNKPNL